LTGNENKTVIDEVLGLCKPCSGSSDNCVSIESTTRPELLAYFLATAEECQEQCGAEKNTCSSAIGCPQGLFCNFQDAEEGGYCEQCPEHIYNCVEGKDLTSQGLNSCERSCTGYCQPISILTITASTTTKTIDDVNAVAGSPQLTVTGPVADCGLGLKPCEDVDGSVCFIERGKTTFWNKVNNCYAGGGIAAVLYNLEAKCANMKPWLSGETYIPSVALTHMAGKAILLEAKAMPPETPILVTIEVGGHEKFPESCREFCTEEIECEGTNSTCNFDNGDHGECSVKEYKAPCNDAASSLTDYLQCTAQREFCDFSLGKRGECLPCPEADGACFFSDLNRQGAFECNSVCTDGGVEELESKTCKFCARGSFDLGDFDDGFTTTEKEEVTMPCEFCASSSSSKCVSGAEAWEMDNPYRTIPLLTTVATCWQVAEFYRSMNIEANTVTCKSARSLNYICGCADTNGYAGANSKGKKIALAWFPRVGAILSILGSSLMIVGVLQDEQKRKKVIGELIVFLCGFDIIGSLGYAFTTYPTPTEDYLYGGNGNAASCVVQGFFIQIGTISLYMNVSVAFYYLLIIQFGWREKRLKKSWLYQMLFVVPILVGAIFAFAGIPFYKNNYLWCNNSKPYWSEAPVAIAIVIATVIMLNLCWFVYKSERASRRFRRHSQEARTSLSTAFFKQSLVYLGAFYLTWPAYLALQISVGHGVALSSYGFVLFAGTSLTLQGFWNYAFHTGLHNRAIGKGLRSAWTSVRNGSTAFVFKSRSRWTDEHASSAGGAL